jgi:hypothetical protein
LLELEKALEAAIVSARTLRQAQEIYDNAIRNYGHGAVERVKPLSEAAFWQITDSYRTLVLVAIATSRAEPPKWAADEMFRIAVYEGTASWWSKKMPHGHRASFFDTFNYAFTYSQYRREYYKLVDAMPQVSGECGKSDDGFGDLMDGLPLLGQTFYQRLQRKRFYNYKHFKHIVRKTVNQFVDELGPDYTHYADKVKRRFTRMILDGENYFGMTLEDMAKEWFPRFYKAEEAEEEVKT